MYFGDKQTIMKAVINKVNRKSTIQFQVNQIASVIYYLYKTMSTDERAQMKPYFAYIKENAVKPLIKKLVAIGKNAGNEEFINLYKKTKRKINWILFTQGTKKNLELKTDFFQKRFKNINIITVNEDKNEEKRTFDLHNGIQIDDVYSNLKTNAQVKILLKILLILSMLVI